MRGGFRHPSLPIVRHDVADIGQFAIAFVPIDAVTDHEMIADLEADVVRPHRHNATGRFIRQDEKTDAGRLLLAKVIEQPDGTRTGIDDVLDDQNVLSFDREAQIEMKLHLSGGGRAAAVAG